MRLPQRKHPRLKDYDYSQPGFYYVTIHTENDSIILSRVEQRGTPPEASVFLSPLGEIMQKQLLALQVRYSYVKIDKYVIMPNHIHMIIQLIGETTAASRRPDIPDIMCAYKSLSTRACNVFENTPGRKVLQTSFYESVLRNEQAYKECWRYIDENPAKWLLDPDDR